MMQQHRLYPWYACYCFYVTNNARLCQYHACIMQRYLAIAVLLTFFGRRFKLPGNYTSNAFLETYLAFPRSFLLAGESCTLGNPAKALGNSFVY